MSNKTNYTCTNCGEVHDGWPALAFDSPTSYSVLPKNIKEEIGELTSDFCIVRHPEQTDRFIRGTLTIRVNDHCEDLEYGLWVSLSEKSFQDYSANFENSNHEAKYFGWLGSDIPEYDVSEGAIPTTVLTRKDGLRPEIIPHEDFDHQLVRDYYEGISKAQAEERIDAMLKIVNEQNSETKLFKQWWKLW